MKGRKELHQYHEERDEKSKRRIRRVLVAAFVGTGLFIAVAIAHGQEIDYTQALLTSVVLAGGNPAALLEEEDLLTEEKKPVFKMSGTASVSNKYLQSTGGVAHDDVVGQAGVTFTFVNGFLSGAYLDFWGSRGEGPWMSSYGDEGNSTAGWSNDHLDVGVSYITASYLAPADIGWVYVRTYTNLVEWKGWATKGYLKVDHFWPLRGVEPKTGSNIHVGADVERRLGSHWSTTLSGDVLYDTGAFGAGEGFVGLAKAEVLRDLGESLRVGVGIKYSHGLTVPRDDSRDGDIAYAIITRF